MYEDVGRLDDEVDELMTNVDGLETDFPDMVTRLANLNTQISAIPVVQPLTDAEIDEICV
jgi:hypothetical protein